MQLMHVRFWSLFGSFVQLTAVETGRQLIDFVGQIKASHLGLCREIAFVHVEQHPVAIGLMQVHPAMMPQYSNDGDRRAAAPAASCGVIFTSLLNPWNRTRFHYTNKAKLLYVIDVMEQASFGISSAEKFIGSQEKWSLFNTVYVFFSDSMLQAYYFEPIESKLQPLVDASRSIYPSLSELHDLKGYDLNSVFIPGEADQLIVDTIMQTLSDRRNCNLELPVGFEASALLNLTATLQWQFTLLTFGPQEYATCFFVPWAGPVPIGYILVEPFDTSTWLGIILTGVVVVLLLKVFGKASLFGSGIMLLQSVFTSPNRIARTPFERRILTSCMLGCMVLVSSYQSIIYSLIANPAHYPELDTEQLINRSCAIYMLNDLGGIDTYRNTFVERDHFRAGKSCICTTCRLEVSLRTHPHLGKQYRISRVRNHPFPMLIALVDRHYPPFNELVWLYVSGFFEAGLTGKMLRDTRLEHEGRYFRAGRTRDVPSQQLRVSDLHIVWIVLKVGLAFATCCFFGELVWKYSRSGSIFRKMAACCCCWRKGSQ